VSQPAERPLQGRRVVVTRSAEQSDALAALLEVRGAIPVVVPLIEIVDEPTGMAALAGLDPGDHDWLVVTSPNGAAAYLRVHAESPRRVAAVGTTTASALRAGGVDVELVPVLQNAEGLADAFPAGEGRVLVVQAVDADPYLAVALTERGWTVTAIAPYRSLPVVPPAGVQLAALAADAVLFASGSAARAWAAVFGDAAPPVSVAIGPNTAAAAAAAGLKISLVAADHSLSGMVAALERYLAR